jgi:hypothetical protein
MALGAAAIAATSAHAAGKPDAESDAAAAAKNSAVEAAKPVDAYSSLLVGSARATGPFLSPSISSDFHVDVVGLSGAGPSAPSEFSSASTVVPTGANSGLKVGVAYAPTLRSCGDRLCTPQQTFVLAPDGTLLSETGRWRDAVEGALYFQQGVKLGNDRLFLGVGANVVNADRDVRAFTQSLGPYESYALGFNLGYRGITLGGTVKQTNAGLASLDEDGYLAFDAGVTFRTGDDKGDWGLMLGYGQAQAQFVDANPMDPQLYRDTQTAQAGVTYYINRGITVGAAAQYVESTKPAAVGGREEAATVVIESSIKF